MNYPIVYDKFETTFTGLGLAVLDNAKNVKIKEVINGEYLLSFLFPLNDDKRQYLQEENIVKVKEQLFRIRSFDIQRDSNGKIESNIQCEHVFYDANDCKFIPSIEMIGVTPRSIFENIFSGTRFSIGTIEIGTLTDIIESKTNPTAVIMKLIENVGGELLRDNWTINLLNRRGSDKKIEIRTGKNLVSLKKTVDSKNVITRLYPYGKDDLDITTVNNGIPYLDSTLITSNYTRCGCMDFKDIESPSEIKAKAIEQFSTSSKDGIDKPRVTYSADIVELKKISEYGSLEAFELGDSVSFIDEAIGVDTIQRIVDYEEYPYEAQRSNVVLTNYSPNIYRDNSIGGMFSAFSVSSQTVSSVTTSNGKVNSVKLDSVRTKLQTDINNVLVNALQHDYADLYVDISDNPTKAILIGKGIFAIANSKLGNGDWNWRTIATGDKVVADEVDAEWVYTGRLSANQIIAGTIDADVINIINVVAESVKSSWVYTGRINAEQIFAGYITGLLETDSITLKGDNGYTPTMKFVRPGYTELMEIYAKSDGSFEFTKGDGIQAANISCGNVNNRNISDLASDQDVANAIYNHVQQYHR